MKVNFSVEMTEILTSIKPLHKETVAIESIRVAFQVEVAY